MLYKELERLTENMIKVELDKDEEPRTDFVKPFKVAKYMYFDPNCESNSKTIVFEVDENDGKKIKNVRISGDHYS